MDKLKGYSLAFISAASYGLIPWFIIPVKRASFPLDTTLFYRFLLAALMLLPVLLIKKESLKINRHEFLFLMMLGLFYGFSSDTLFKSYDLLTPGIASTLLFVYPIFIALILLFFYKERVKKLVWLAMLVTLGGVYVLSVEDSLLNINVLGLITVFGAALFYALYIISVNKSKLEISGWKMTFYSLLITSIYYLVKTQIFGESLVLPDKAAFYNFALFALVTTVISTTALVYAVKYIGSTPTAIMGAMEPVVAVLVSVYLFDELMTPALVLGVILILTGVIMSILAESKKRIIRPPGKSKKLVE